MNITKGDDSLTARIMFGFDIPPEMFTREDIARADEVDLRQIKDVLRRLRRSFNQGYIPNALYSAIQLENARVNPEGYTTFIPGVDDQPEGEMVLNVNEAIEEMREIELAAGN